MQLKNDEVIYISRTEGLIKILIRYFCRNKIFVTIQVVGNLIKIFGFCR